MPFPLYFVSFKSWMYSDLYNFDQRWIHYYSGGRAIYGRLMFTFWLLFKSLLQFRETDLVG